MSLKKDLELFDGKHISMLERIAEHYRPSSARIAELLELAGAPNPRMQQAATWILKRWLETGTSLSDEHIKGLTRVLSKIHHWEAMLHICQMLSHLAIPRSCKKKIESFLLARLTEENKFVRAWAYNGLYELVKQLGDTGQVMPLLMKGMNDEAASVRARVKNILEAIDTKRHRARHDQ